MPIDTLSKLIRTDATGKGGPDILGKNIRDIANSLSKTKNATKKEIDDLNDAVKEYNNRMQKAIDIQNKVINSEKASEKSKTKALNRLKSLNNAYVQAKTIFNTIESNLKNINVLEGNLTKTTENLSNKTEKLTLNTKELFEIYSKTIENIKPGIWEELIENSSHLNKEFESLRKNFDDNRNSINKSVETVKKLNLEIINQSNELAKNQNILKNSKELNEENRKEIEKNISTISEEIKSNKERLNGEVENQKVLRDSVENQKEFITQELESIKTQKDFKKELDKSIKSYTKQKNIISSTTWNKIIKSNQEMGKELKEQKKEYEKSIEIYEKNRKSLVNLKNTYTSLIKEKNESKNATIDEIAAKQKSIDEIKDKIDKLLGENEALKENIDNIENLVEATEDIISRDEDLISKTSLLGKFQSEAKEEVRQLANGLGKEAIGVTALAVTFIYLGKKIDEYSDKLLDVQKNWATYNVQTGIAARTIPDFSGGINGLSQLKKELNLNREESINFNKTLQEGAISGVVSTNQLIDAAKQLTETFGEDPTSRLQNYVDLLKTIPTLETDISINASMDDQTAAWFALAEKGKVSQAIELQMAGILGGEKEIPEDQMKTAVESLKAQRKMSATMESIEQMFSNWIPSSSSYFISIASSIGSVALTTAGLYKGYHVLNNLLEKTKDTLGGKLDQTKDEIVEATENVESAIREDKKIGRGPKTSRKAKDKIKDNKSIENFLDRYRRKSSAIEKSSMGRFTPNFLKKLRGGGISKGFDLMNRGLTTGGIRGTGLDILGKTIAGLNTNMGSIAGTVGTGGAVSTAIAGFAGVVSAAIGPFVLVGKYGETAGKALKDFGSNLQSEGGVLSGFVNGVGSVISGFGGMLETAGKYWSKKWKDIVGESKEEILKKKEIKWLKQEEILRKKLVTILKPTQDSALAMEKALNFITNASESSITALAKLGKEVSEINLDILADIGGTATDFKNTLENGIKSTENEFKHMNTAFAKAREMILTDGKINAEHRKAALLKLNRAELDATKTFIDGMMNMIGRFDKIPSIAAEELRIGMRNIMKDLKLDLGADIFGDTFDMITENINSSFRELSAATEQMGKDFDTSRKMISHTTNKLELDTKDIISEIQTYKENTDDATVGFVNEVSSAINEKDIEKISKIGIKISDAIGKLQKGIDKAPTENLAASFDEVSIELENARNNLKRNKNVLEKMSKNTKEYNDQEEKVDELKEKEKDLLSKKTDLGFKILEAYKDETKIEAATFDIAKEDMENAFKEKESKQKKLGILDRIKKATELYNSDAERSNLALKASAKITEETSNKMRVLLTNLNDLSEYIERGPEAQTMQRSINILEHQSDLEMRLGKDFTKTTELFEKRLEKSKTQLKLSNNILKTLEQLGKGGDAAKVAMQTTIDSFDGLKKSMESYKFNENKDLQEKLSAAFGKPINSVADATKDSYELMNKKMKEIAIASEKGASKDVLKSLGKEYIEASNRFYNDLEKVKTISGGAFDPTTFKQQETLSRNLANVQINGIKKTSDEVKASQADINKTMHENIDAVDKYSDAVYDTITQKVFSATLSAAQSTAELAEEQWDLVSANKSYGNSLVALENQRKKALDDISEREKTAIGLLDEEITEAISGGKTELAYDLRAKREEQIAKFTELRADAEKNFLNNAKQARDILLESALKQIEIQKEQNDLQLDLAQAMGSNMGTIYNLQMDALNLARKERDEKEKVLELTIAGGGSTEEIERRRLEYSKASADVQKKAMGAQRDAYDKLLEKAFGAIRSSRGGKRQLMTTAQMFGPGYVENKATGLIGGGKSMTLAQRQAGFAFGTSSKKSEETTDKTLNAANIQNDAANTQRDAINIFSSSVGGLQTIFNTFGKQFGMTKNALIPTRHPIETMAENRTTATNQSKAIANAIPPATTRTPDVANQQQLQNANNFTVQNKDTKINVELSFKIDPNGNIIPTVRKVLQTELPSALKTPASTGAMQQAGFVKV